MKKSDSIGELLTRSVSEVIDKKHLEEALNSGKRLRIKLGIDPTGAQLHLGHAVILRILRRFQDAGHTAVLIIGDTTASIGDPSGKNETRPQLSSADIEKNFATYEKQALKILDKSNMEVRRQSEWFSKFTLSDVIREASKLSAGWITSHETFRNRLKEGNPLAFHELLYPLVQAYDSIAVKADVELGGPDQKFNLLTGRELMRAHGLTPQDIVLGRYLIGTDGQKMGKSLGNYIALEEEPFEMFSRAMAIEDSLILEYFELATEVPMDEVKSLEKELQSGANPRDIKKRLAQQIVTLYHGADKASKAADEWAKVFSNKEKPTEIETLEVSESKRTVIDVLIVSGAASSTTTAKALVEQGGVKFNDKIVNDPKQELDEGLLQIGKRRFKKLVIKK